MFAMSSTIAAGAVRAGPSTRAGSRANKSVIAASGATPSTIRARASSVRAQRSTLVGQPVVSAR